MMKFATLIYVNAHLCQSLTTHSFGHRTPRNLKADGIHCEQTAILTCTAHHEILTQEE